MNDNGSILKRPSSFWLTIAAAIVTGSVAFTTLSNKVQAMTEREQLNKETFLREVERNEDMHRTILEINDRMIRMEKDIEYIRGAIIVVGE